MADPPVPGLSDEEVHDLIRRLETLLERLERATGPVAEVAAQAVETLATVYGTALGRVMALAGGTPQVVASLVEDELVHHLLALHGVHPQPTGERIDRAIEELRDALRARGDDVELAGVEDGVARLRWSVSTACGAKARGSSSAPAGPAIQQAISDAVLAAAPELRGVETVSVPARRPPAVIPVEALLRRPTGPAGARGGVA